MNLNAGSNSKETENAKSVPQEVVCNVRNKDAEAGERCTCMNKKVNIKMKILVLLLLVILFIAGILFLLIHNAGNKEPENEIITEAALGKIVNISELSAYTAVYNGIAEVYNEKKTEDVDYYVAYEAKVNAGIDFEKVEISVDNQNKIVTIDIPQIQITTVNVDIASMDYMFFNDKANTSTVSETAYKACEIDVKKECEEQKAIYELAEQNVKNILTALTKPIIEQVDAEYLLVID